MKKFVHALYGTVLSVATLSVPAAVLAQGNLSNSGNHLRNVGNRLGISPQNDLPTVAGQVISTALTLVGIIFLILMVYAGYLWMTARGDEGQVEKALGIVKTCIIGLVVVMSAYAITFFVLSRFGTR